MDDNVKNFPPIKDKEGLVPFLTSLLDRARLGEIDTVAVAILYTDKDVGFMIPTNTNHYKLLGAIYAMAQEMQLDKITNG